MEYKRKIVELFNSQGKIEHRVFSEDAQAPWNHGRPSLRAVGRKRGGSTLGVAIEGLKRAENLTGGGWRGVEPPREQRNGQWRVRSAPRRRADCFMVRPRPYSGQEQSLT